MDNNITVLIGVLLTISEILPYIKQIKSNGIIEFLTDNIIKIYRIKMNSFHIQDNLQETEPLLANNTYNNVNYLNDNVHQNLDFSSNLNNNVHQNLDFSSNLNANVKPVNDSVNININSENVLLKFNTSNVEILLDVDEKKSEVSKNSEVIN